MTRKIESMSTEFCITEEPHQRPPLSSQYNPKSLQVLLIKKKEVLLQMKLKAPAVKGLVF